MVYYVYQLCPSLTTSFLFTAYLIIHIIHAPKPHILCHSMNPFYESILPSPFLLSSFPFPFPFALCCLQQPHIVFPSRARAALVQVPRQAAYRTKYRAFKSWLSSFIVSHFDRERVHCADTYYCFPRHSSTHILLPKSARKITTVGLTTTDSPYMTSNCP